MINEEIRVHRARVHNLKNISVSVPKNSLTVITGPSGSGKSSIAFDTIYVEGQRRYIESLSSYARQFLGQFSPPDVDAITGLSPAIAIDQKSGSKNPRSTVGTITEIYDYLRILYARTGELFCPITGKQIRKYTPGQVAKIILETPINSKIQLLAPVGMNLSGDKLQEEVTKYLGMGFVRGKLNGQLQNLDNLQLSPKKKYHLAITIDRLTNRDGIAKRLVDSIEYCYKIGNGSLEVLVNDHPPLIFHEHNISPATGEVLPELEPQLFSFNSPIGACPDCSGLGETKIFDIAKIITDDTLSIPEGAIAPLAKKNTFMQQMTRVMATAEKVDLNLPLKKLSSKFRQMLFYGSEKSYSFSFESENSQFNFRKPYPGIIPWLQKKYLESESEKVKWELESYMEIKCCPGCGGQRLNKMALSTKINQLSIMDLCNFSVFQAIKWLTNLHLEGERKIIAAKLLKEILGRLNFLQDVGLEYLTLNRPASGLSGGENQRIRLATQIGSALSGVIYVLDEPSIGLHQRDNSKLINTLHHLKNLGNTVIVVEHDEETIRQADYIIDLGPGAGMKGGEVVFQGKLEQLLADPHSLTADYLTGRKKIAIPTQRKITSDFIKLKGASKNNLKKINVEIPLHCLTCITGVSGSGKSSLIHETLVPAIRSYLTHRGSNLYQEAFFQSISGLSKIQSIIELDQSAIGRTPHSNPATYTGVFDEIRKLFAATTESQVRGYRPGRFSFNVKGGRCEECEGNGVKKIEMHFLPDVYITCAECNGKRYNRETLSVLYKGKNISDILNLSIAEGAEFFRHHSKIHRILSTLEDVGLGYMAIGQSATTLSGGEAQRLKISRELAKSTKGQCLYVLDEPTTGLHFHDINILLGAIFRLIEKGNSVIVIEHNLDVIKTADYIIDIGPGGGENGGELVFAGTPEQLAHCPASYTGQYLKTVLLDQ